MLRRIHANSANLFHERSPLYEICKQPHSGTVDAVEAVHTNIMGEPKSPEEKRGSASDSKHRNRQIARKRLTSIGRIEKSPPIAIAKCAHSTQIRLEKHKEEDDYEKRANQRQIEVEMAGLNDSHRAASEMTSFSSGAKRYGPKIGATSCVKTNRRVK